MDKKNFKISFIIPAYNCADTIIESIESIFKGNFEDGETHELVFPDPGTYNYHNHLNASQTGSVVVE